MLGAKEVVAFRVWRLSCCFFMIYYLLLLVKGVQVVQELVVFNFLLEPLLSVVLS